MGEESDGDADLPEDADSPGEVDEPTAGPASESGGSDGPPADEPDSEEPSASPSDDLVENGGTPSPTEPDAVDPDADEQSDADEASDDETDEESDDEAGDDESGGDDQEEDANDGSGNLQPVESPDVSLNPNDLTSDKPVVTNRERPEPPAEQDDPESTARPEVHQPPEGAEPPKPEPAGPEPPERDSSEPVAPGEGSAPLAEDVATPDVDERSEPLEDEEMPLADHIEEMLKRLAVVLVIAGVVSLAVLPISETAINFLWNSVLPAGESTRPRLYGPLALVFTKLKVASLAGLVIALPVFVYETYLFMRPGLYPHERRYYLAAVPTSLVLAFVGISFAYFLILPIIFEYFLYYSEDVTTIAFALTKTFNLILLLMGYLAIVFQIPLFIMLAIMMGLTTRRWLVERRLYFWGAFLGIAFLFSPDPTGMAPIMVAATMVGLFEGTLFLLKWTGR